MKKVFTLVALAGLTSLVACGPSKAEQEKAQHIKDSIAQDSLNKIEVAKQEHINDSLKKVEEAKAALEAHVKDSLHQDSVDKKLIKPAAPAKH